MDEKQKIATTIYRPKGQPRAIFRISHGMAEHRLRYAEFAQNLAQLGFVVVTSDHRGHGGSAASPEELGYFNKHKGWQKCVNDLYELMIQVKQEYPDVPVILFGHSMGSIMARSFVKRYDALLNGLRCAELQPGRLSRPDCRQVHHRAQGRSLPQQAARSVGAGLVQQADPQSAHAVRLAEQEPGQCRRVHRRSAVRIPVYRFSV